MPVARCVRCVASSYLWSRFVRQRCPGAPVTMISSARMVRSTLRLLVPFVDYSSSPRSLLLPLHMLRAHAIGGRRCSSCGPAESTAQVPALSCIWAGGRDPSYRQPPPVSARSNTPCCAILTVRLALRISAGGRENLEMTDEERLEAAVSCPPLRYRAHGCDPPWSQRHSRGDLRTTHAIHRSMHCMTIACLRGQPRCASHGVGWGRFRL